MIFTKEDEISHNKVKECYLCKDTFYDFKTKDDKHIKTIIVRDHDHYTGEYRGAAH